LKECEDLFKIKGAETLTDSGPPLTVNHP